MAASTLRNQSSMEPIFSYNNIRSILLRQWTDFIPWFDSWNLFLKKLHEIENPFYQADWLQAAWDYPGSPMSLSILLQGDEIIAAMAFCSRWDTGSSVLIPVRSIHAMPHLPMLYPSSSLLLTLQDVPPSYIAWGLDQTLKQLSWDVGLIGYLNHHTLWFEKSLHQIVQQNRWILREAPCSNEAVIDFTKGFDYYWETRSGEMKRKINKGERLLLQSGNIKIIDASEEGYSWEQCWELIQAIYNSSWQKNAGLSPFDLPWRAVNLRHIESYYQKNRMRLYMLCMNGTPIAYDLWLTGGTTLYGLARGMNPEYRYGSPGDVLAKWEIEKAHQQNFTCLYMGPVSDQPHFAYKKRWMTNDIPYHKIQFIRPRSWYGIIDQAVNRIPLIHWIWDKCGLTARSRKFFYKLQSLKNRYRR